MNEQEINRINRLNSKIAESYALIDEMKTLVAALTDCVPACESAEYKALEATKRSLNYVLKLR